MSDLETQESNEVDATKEAPEKEISSTEFMAEQLAEMRGRGAAKPDDSEVKYAEVVEKTRSPDGKFAKADDKAKSDKQDKSKTATTTQDAEKPTDSMIQAALVQPPTSFSAAGKEECAKASPAIQQEILKREGDFHKYYQTTQKEIEPIKQAANFGQEIYQALRPFEQTIRGLGVPPAQAIHGLFAADHKLRYGAPHEKIQAFADLAKGYGIDLSQGLPEQQHVDPNVEYLQRQNQHAMQTAQQAQQQIQQMRDEFTRQQMAAEESQLNSVIEQAKKGKAHFDELRQEIGMILQSSINRAQQSGLEPMTLDQAYEAALWQSPKHRAELLAKQQADADAAAAQKRAEDAEKAKLAKRASSVNVQKRGTMQAQVPVGNATDFIREKLAEIRSR